MRNNHPEYRTSPKERLSYWTFFVGLNVFYNMIASTFFYLFYKLNDKDVQIMASCNAGSITREEAQRRLSRKYQ